MCDVVSREQRENRMIYLFLIKYENMLPKSSMPEILSALEKMSEFDVASLLIVPLKRKMVTFCLATFLGGFALDRFYIRDYKHGLLKLLVWLGVIVTSNRMGYIAEENITLGLSISYCLLLIIGIVWQLTDIVLSFHHTKLFNEKIVRNTINVLNKFTESEKQGAF